MKYTQIPTDAFKEMQLNAGILVDSFTPSSGVIGNLIGATTGGVSFKATPTYTDFGDDIDNCPKNMMELKKLDSWEATLSGTFVTVTTAIVKKLIGAADVDTTDTTKVTPRNDITTADFSDIWWVGDYSDKNSDDTAGFCAVHLLNALSTDGLQITSTDKAKGQFAFTFTGHYSEENADEVPFEVYVKQGS